MTHKQVIVMRKDLNMRKGKIAAQASHSSLGAILGIMTTDGDGNKMLDMSDSRVEPWINGRFKKICVYVNSEEELHNLKEKADQQNLINCLIKDSGLTEFNGVATYTCLCIGPDVEEKIDAITGNLPLF